MSAQGRAKSLRPGLSRKIEQAGASAHQWHEEAMLDFLDKSGRLRRVTGDLSRVVTGATVVLLAFLLAVRGEVLPVMAGVGVGVGFAMRGLRAPHWGVSILALLAAIDHSSAASLAVSIVVLAVVAAWVVLRPRHKDRALLVAAAAAALSTTFLGEGVGYSLVLASSVVGVLGVSVWLSGSQGVASPFTRVTEADLNAYVPSPPSAVPWLMRRAMGARMEKAPREVVIKKAGAYGERKTGVILLGLVRGRGTRIVHDVMIPGARSANADHVVVARSGLFIIDSKQFGTRADPGLVTYDMGSREIVHRSRRGAKSVEPSPKTAVWAAEAISNVVGTKGRVVLAVHAASVAKGLRVERNGVRIDVVSAWELPEVVDGSPQVVTLGKLATARMNLFRLKSATSKGAPAVAAPVGMTSGAKALVEAKLAEARGPESGAGSKPGNRSARRSPEPLPRPKALNAPQEAGGGWGGVAPAMSAQELVGDRWEQMRVSERAPHDEVEEGLRQLWRGAPVTIVDIGDKNASSFDAVAMTGVCAGVEENYIWYCSPEQYRIHKEYGCAVNVSTAPVGRVMLRSEGGGAQ